jgi:hypothetical protein
LFAAFTSAEYTTRALTRKANAFSQSQTGQAVYCYCGVPNPDTAALAGGCQRPDKIGGWGRQGVHSRIRFAVTMVVTCAAGAEEAIAEEAEVARATAGAYPPAVRLRIAQREQ